MSEETNAFAAWHELSGDQALTRLGSTVANGLSAAEAAERRRRFGPNRLAEPPPPSRLERFLRQFANGLTLTLMGAGVAAGLLGDVGDAAVIGIVLLLNAVLGYSQEARAERALAALKDMVAHRARVRRDGHTEEIAAEDLVPGDLLLIEAGDRVAADGRLVVARNLDIDESALTGESQPAGKHDAVLPPGASALGDRHNMAFMNTVATRGRGEILVTATGMATEMGRLAGLLATAAVTATPLQQQLDRLGKHLSWIAAGIIAVILGLSLLRGIPVIEALFTAITLAVAAIPEGLPAVVTVTLAIGMRRMAGRNAIVKSLAAVETLGCASVICSDKTGTLTLNEMTARRLFIGGRWFRVSGEGYRAEGRIAAEDGGALPDLKRILAAGALCATSRIVEGRLIGDPTEGALLALAAKAGLDSDALAAAAPRLAELPFDSAHKFMVTVHDQGDGRRLLVKGAPDVVLARARAWRTTDGSAPLDTQAVAAANAAMGGEAMRVMALAERTLAAEEDLGDVMALVRDLELLALVGIIDPPRPEAREAIALCRHAGIAVKMITGDHAVTGHAVARQLGLEGEAIDGTELDRLDDAALAERLGRIAVVARVAPEHKVRIVEVLQARGQVVAMTGDGVNDAPALKRAHIGVAMGRTGTAVTREAAAMVLADDNFASIVGAVEEGRTIYANIVKFVRFQLTTNIGALATIFGATVAGLPMPFNPIHILWVNIIMDGPPAMALGLDPAAPGRMREAPRDPAAQILAPRRLLRLLLLGLVMAGCTLGIFTRALAEGDPAHATTLAFTAFVFMQFFNNLNCRDERESAFSPLLFRNGKLWAALAAMLVLQVLAVEWEPAQKLLHTTALSGSDWLLTVMAGAVVLVVEEARKALARVFER